MRIELVMTGDELLDGRVLNSNERDIALMLSERGFRVERATTVGDHPQHLKQAFEDAKNRVDAVIVTGGLGPTDDDRTLEMLASVAKVGQQRDESVVESLKAFYQRIQRPMAESNLKQADIPKGGRILPNQRGTAPGVHLQIEQCHFFALPGVPREMRYMLEQEVLPSLEQLAGTSQPLPSITTFKCFGLGESNIADLLVDLYPLEEGVEIGYRAIQPEVHVKLLVRAEDHETARKQAQPLISQLAEKLGAHVFGVDQQSFVQSLAEALRAQGMTLALAESCTGGLIASMITAEAGVSDFFQLSAVTYSNAAKSQMLGIPMQLIDEHGAVSEAVARAMAEGARRVGEADIAVSVTGVAGPSGGSPDKPVGTVHMAVATQHGTWHKHFLFPGHRERIQRWTAYTALQFVKESIDLTHPLPQGSMRYEHT